MFYSWVLFCLGCLFLILRGAVSWEDLFKLAFCCVLSLVIVHFFLFSFGLGMDTYRWAEGVSVTTAKAFKKGLLFFLLFSFVSSFRRRARLSGRKNFIGYKQMGFGLFAKDGAYWIWGGLGQNIARTKCGIGCGVGSVFFPFSFPFPFPTKSTSLGFSWIGSAKYSFLQDTT